MYLKFIRHTRISGDVRRGTLYSVHFQPNEKGGYNEHLTVISDAYEIAYTERFPLPLIYPVGVVKINGFRRLSLGDARCRSALHLIDIGAREELLTKLQEELRGRAEVRIEVGGMFNV